MEGDMWMQLPKSKKFFLVFGSFLIAAAFVMTIPAMNMSCNNGENPCLPYLAAGLPCPNVPNFDDGDGCIVLGAGTCSVAGKCCDAAASCPAGTCCLLNDTSASNCTADTECCSGNCDIDGTDTCCLVNNIEKSPCTAGTECCSGNCDIGGTGTCCTNTGPTSPCSIYPLDPYAGQAPDNTCCSGFCGNPNNPVAGGNCCLPNGTTYPPCTALPYTLEPDNNCCEGVCYNPVDYSPYCL